MFERYCEDARRAIFFARWEALQCGSARIETEHLLLGLAHEVDSKVNQLFHLDAHAETFRSRLGVLHCATEQPQKDIPLSNPSKRVLAYTAEEAERLRSKPIGTEHLLLGLLREKKSDVSAALANDGIDLRSARTVIGQNQASSPPENEHEETKALNPLRALALLIAVVAMIYVIVSIVLRSK